MKAAITSRLLPPPHAARHLTVSIVIDLEPDHGRVEAVLHPTDLSRASLTAFHHALAIAIRIGAEFTLLHAVGRRSTDSAPDFPAVRDTLARWHSAGSTRGLEEKIRNSSVRKLELRIRDPVAACLHHMERNHVDMIVLATEGRTGLARLVRPSRAEALARESRRYTFFVPSGGRSIVDGDTGAVTLHRILVPIDPATDPKPAMVRAVESAALLEDPALEITLLHVGGEGNLPATDLPQLPFCQWRVLVRGGEDVASEILEAAQEIGADAIFMSSSWQRPRLGRSARGVTEDVLEHVTCPLAVVPVHAAG